MSKRLVRSTLASKSYKTEAQIQEMIEVKSEAEDVVEVTDEERETAQVVVSPVSHTINVQEVGEVHTASLLLLLLLHLLSLFNLFPVDVKFDKPILGGRGRGK